MEADNGAWFVERSDALAAVCREDLDILAILLDCRSMECILVYGERK